MTYSNITGRIMGSAFAALVLLTLALSPAFAKASDLSEGWVDTGTYETWEPTYSSYDDYGWVDTAYYDTYDPTYDTRDDYGWVDTAYYDTYDPTYDSYGYPSYSSPGYASSIGGSSSFGSAGFIGSSGFVGSVGHPVRSGSSVSNTCTAPNTCNTSYDDHSVFNAPTVVTINDSGNTYKEEKKESKKKNYDNDYVYKHKVAYVPPPVYQPAPYIALSQTPYTGLELGPMGTALYWSFLVLWCLFCAYLIAVKKVHLSAAARIKAVLFGEEDEVATETYVPEVAPQAPIVSPRVSLDVTDSFILAQLNRSK